MLVCGKPYRCTCENVEILWVSFRRKCWRCRNTFKTTCNRMIWNGVVTPYVCGKKVLAIGLDTFFIVYDIVQQTYVVCYCFLIAVIHAICNATETELLFLTRRGLVLDQLDLHKASLFRPEQRYTLAQSNTAVLKT